MTPEQFTDFRHSFQVQFPGFNSYLEKIPADDRNTLFAGWYQTLRPFDIDDLVAVIARIQNGTMDEIEALKYGTWAIEMAKRARLIIIERRQRNEFERNREAGKQYRRAKQEQSAVQKDPGLQQAIITLLRSQDWAKESGLSKGDDQRLHEAIVILMSEPTLGERREQMRVLEELGCAELFDDWTKPLAIGERIKLVGEV